MTLEASLLKTNAYTDYFNSKQRQQQVKNFETGQSLVGIIFIALIIGTFIWCFTSCVLSKEIAEADGFYYTDVAPTQEVNAFINELLRYDIDDFEANRPKLSITEEVNEIMSRPNYVRNIPRIIYLLQRYCFDANGDGLINCIDYTLIFRMMYGSNAKIMLNVNPKTNMNHMHIRVFYGEYAMDIEPQGKPGQYSMGQVWGTRFDHRLSRDVTAQWTTVVGGM